MSNSRDDIIRRARQSRHPLLVIEKARCYTAGELAGVVYMPRLWGRRKYVRTLRHAYREALAAFEVIAADLHGSHMWPVPEGQEQQ